MQKILFLCPHGAAKSVLARAFMDELINANGLALESTNAGTEPDPKVPGHVVELLKRRGHDYSTFVPRMATSDDVIEADIIVSLGCPIEELITGRSHVIYWNDTPMVSAGVDEASRFIEGRVKELFGQLQGAAT